MLLLGCPAAEEDFDCTEDSQCTLETVMGICEPNRWCSFPSPDCPSGRRYGEQAGQGLAGTCVPAEGSTSSESGTTSAPAGTSTSTSTAEPGSTSGSMEDSTGPSTSSSTGGTDSNSDATGSGSSTGPSPGDPFFDDFDRPDSSELGNGWVERTPGTWELEGNRVVFAGEAAPYQDSAFYRPFDEAVLDLETSVEFTYVLEPNFSTPQLHARIQEEAQVGTESTNAYLVYMPQPDDLVVSRVEVSTFALTNSAVIDPPIELDERCRLTLRVTGTGPVEIVGTLERFDAETKDWVEAQVVTLSDSDETRIVDPGSFGASGHQSVTFVYDNFTMTPL